MKQLLFSLSKKDFDIELFHCGGHGGQNVNKVETGVRIRHKASEAVSESRTARTQYANKKLAFERLIKTKKFQTWHRMECARRMAGRTVEDVVNAAMAPMNITIEVVGPDGKWVKDNA